MKELIIKKKEKDMNKKCQKFLVDIFNLIFGSGNETDDFWIKILEKKVNEQF